MNYVGEKVEGFPRSYRTFQEHIYIIEIIIEQDS